MTKDPTTYLNHILQSISRIKETTKSVSEERFADDYQIHDIVIRELEVIGEACRNLAKEFQNTHPEIPWALIISSRNLLIHEYWGVDLAEVWHTAQVDLPVLQKSIQAILEQNS